MIHNVLHSQIVIFTDFVPLPLLKLVNVISVGLEVIAANHLALVRMEELARLLEPVVVLHNGLEFNALFHNVLEVVQLEEIVLWFRAHPLANANPVGEGLIAQLVYVLETVSHAVGLYEEFVIYK
jgi:hypothetical protein